MTTPKTPPRPAPPGSSHFSHGHLCSPSSLSYRPHYTPHPNLSICKFQGAAFKAPRIHPAHPPQPLLGRSASTPTIPQPLHRIPTPSLSLTLISWSPPQHPLPCPTMSPFIPFLHLSPSHSSFPPTIPPILHRFLSPSPTHYTPNIDPPPRPPQSAPPTTCSP